MTISMNQPRIVACPICGRAVPWTTESRYRPFCSERCKQIDLGAWASGEYRVPAVEAHQDLTAFTSPTTPPE